MKTDLYSSLTVLKKSLVALSFLGITFGTQTSNAQCPTTSSTGGCNITADYINDFNLTYIRQAETNCSANGYFDYDDDYNDTLADFNQNTSYPYTIEFGTTQNMHLAIWIDFNDDISFSADEIVFRTTNNPFSGTGLKSGSITIPSGITIGQNKKMRVRARLNSAIAATEGCSAFNTGETHDYRVHISCGPMDAPTFITGEDTVCKSPANITYITSASLATGFSWILPPGAITTSTSAKSDTINVDFANAASGNIEVTAINNNGACTSSPYYSEPIIVSSLVTAGNLTDLSTTRVCRNLAASNPPTKDVDYVINAVPGATMYTWSLPTSTGVSFVGSSSGTNLTTVKLRYTGKTNANAAQPNDNVVLSVIVTNVCGNGPPKNYNIIVSSKNPEDPKSISGDGITCPGDIEVYSIPSTAADRAADYIWTIPGTYSKVSGDSTASLTVNYSASAVDGNIQVRPSNGCGIRDGLAATSTKSIIVPQPVATTGNITGLSSACQGQTGVPYSINAVSNARFYTWNLPSGATIATGANSPTITVNYSDTATSGNVTVLANNECYSGTISQTYPVAVNPLPDAAGAISGEDTVCQGQTGVVYTVPTITNATLYNWTLPTGASIVGSGTGSSITVNFSSTAVNGNVSVFASNSCGNGTISANFKVEVIPTPGSAGAISGPALVCQANNSVAYTVPAITNAANYIWTVPTGAVKVAGDGTNTLTIDFTNASSGNVTVRGVGAKACGTSNTATLAVTVTPSVPADADSIVGSSGVCPGENGVSYSVPVISGATGYTWTVPGSATIASGANTNSITVNFPANASQGNITVKGTNICGTGGESSKAVAINFALPGPVDSIVGASPVCQGLTGLKYYVNSPSTNATSYIWTVPTGATIVAGQGTDSITVNFSTTFTGGNITVKGSNACGNGSTSSKTVTHSPLPTAAGAITGSATVCQGQNSVTFSVGSITNATSYVWIVPSDVSIISGINTNSITVNYSSSAVNGNISVSGRNSCGDGTSASKSITVNPLPVAAGTISGSSVACQGQTGVTFSVPTIANATSYAWTVPTGATITAGGTTNSITVSFSPTASSENITVKGNNTCGDGALSSHAITLTSSAPSAAGAITGASTLCQGQNGVSFSITAVANATGYTWNLPSGASIAGGTNTNSITVDFSANASSGSMSVFASNACGNGAVSPAKSITLSPLPSAAGTVTGDSLVCQGENGVSYSVPIITNATGYAWSIPSGAAIASGFNARTITVNYANSATSGNVSVMGTNSCGSGTASANHAITVNTMPAAAGTISGPTTACQGETGVVYAVPAVANATLYNWTLPSGASIVGSSTDSSVTVNFSSSAVSGNMIVHGVNSCGNGTSSSKSITINALPASAGAISGSATVCQGQNNIVYSVGGIAHATSYIWSIPAGATRVSDDSTNTITVNYSSSALNGGVVSVFGKNNCGVGASSNKIITVKPLPAAADTIFGPSTVCQGETGIIYSVPVIANATGYAWVLPSGATITAGANTDSITVSFSSSATSSNIIVSGTNSCGSGNSANIAIDVFPLPAAAGTISGPDAVCQGDTVIYSVPPIANAINYDWAFPAGATKISGGNTNTVTVKFSSSTVSGSATVKGTNNCGSGATANKAITVNPLPAAAKAIIGTASVCHGQNNVVYSVTGIANATRYIWSIPPGAIRVADDSTNTITVNYPSSSDSGNISVFGQNSCGNGAISNKFITVKPFPDAAGTISGPATPCKGDTVTYAVAAIANATGYNWVLPTGTAIITGSNTESITVSFSATATFNITVNGTNSCGSGPASANYTVTVKPYPSAAGTITGSATVCQGENNIIYSISSIANAAHYIWSISPDADIISGDSTNSITVNYSTSATDHNISVYGENGCGSGKNSVQPITVNPLPAPAGAITGEDTVCQGENNIAYSVGAIANADYYIWSVPTGAVIISGDSTNAIAVNYSSSAVNGNVTVFGKNSNCNNGISANYPVIVKPLPVDAGLITGSNTVCQGEDSVAYQVPVIANADYYIWSVASVPGATIISGDSTNSILVNFSATAVSGDITVMGENDCGNGKDTSFSVVVNAVIGNAGTITGTNTVCQGQLNVAYNIPAIAGADYYVWALPAGAKVAAGDSTESIMVDFSPAAVPGNISVFAASACGNGTPSPNFGIIVNVLPDTADPIAGRDTVCLGDSSVSYSVPVIGNITGYNWTVPANATWAPTSANGDSITVHFGPGTLTGNITVNGVNACGDGVAAIFEVTVIQPVDSANNISGTDPVCQGQDSVAYEVPVIPNADHYIWSLPEGVSIVSGDSTNMIKVNFSRAAVSGNIIVYGVNNCFEGDSSLPFAVTVNPLPDSAEVITGLDLVCPGTTGVVYTVPEIANVNSKGYIWTIPAGLIKVAGDSTRSITLDFPAAPVSGNYEISVAAINGCGYGIGSSIDVKINSVPAPSFNYSIDSDSIGKVIFENTTTNAATYTWIFGDGSPSDTATSPTHHYQKDGSYLVVLTAHNACGSDNLMELIELTGGIGIEEMVNETELDIYPNPTMDRFNVNFNGSSSMLEVKLINTSGSVIYTESIHKFRGKFQKSYDLKNAARGVYFLQLITDEQVITRKVVLN